MKKITQINDVIDIIEEEFVFNDKNHTSVYIYDKKNDIKEYIGTTYEKITYIFNSYYVVFMNKNKTERVFDINEFDFIIDNTLQEEAYKRTLK